MGFSPKNLLQSIVKDDIKQKEFEENVKNSFIRAKEHIKLIENEIKTNKEIILKQNEQIELIFNEIKKIKEDLDKIKEKIKENEVSSTGNEGVYSNIHSFNKYSFNSYAQTKPAISMLHASHKEIQEMFSKLSKQELLTFLTIYQLEEDKGQIGYIDVANYLKLTEGCIRTYVSSLIRKGIPLLKLKHNNKQIFLSIPYEFRSLNLKNELMALYYRPSLPEQKTLTELP